VAQSAGPRFQGRIPFSLPPHGEQAFLMRALPDSLGQVAELSPTRLRATVLEGAPPGVRVEGQARVAIKAPQRAPEKEPAP
jgi:hypothetical protein